MPLYVYNCTRCDEQFEDFSSIADRGLMLCKACGGETRIVPGIGKNKTIVFPGGLWEHIGPEPLEINSRGQLREACKKNGCYAKYDDGYLGV